ncbi:hypothetical protein B1A67_00635 [Clostridium botulinum D/C]|nr:hypothetical protein B1A66_00590 [Clostridium botulinum D/C]OOV58363.1 hypothetical protein B0673_02680 [Clostridium botulinum D/C]OOV59574.1 hypothetical protein B1A67_00635 [Clostridium botulinum D/C]
MNNSLIRLKYFDTIRHLLRSGKASDPYVLKVTQEKIINNKLNLDEIPDPLYHVRIEDYVEIDENTYYKTREIKSNQFYVEYDNGVLYFNPTEEGKTVKIEYKGRGVLQFPAERIWVHNPNPWVIDNLQELIDFIFEKERLLNEKFSKFTQLVKDKTKEINDKVDNFTELLKKKTDEYEHYIDEWIKLANTKIKTITECIIRCNEQTKKCEETTQESKDWTEKAKVIWKPSIPSFLHIDEKYPFPELGWTTICDDNGDVIRFDGSAWIKQGNIVGAVPLATPQMKGLMSKEDKWKMDNVQEGAEKNLRGDDLKDEISWLLKTKSITFTVPNEVTTGDVGYMLQAPCEGKIVRITGIAQEPCISGEWAEFSIIKSSFQNLNDYSQWKEITDKYNRLKFLGYSRISQSPNILNYNIDRNDVFRLICTRKAEGLKNVTIQIDYEV